MRAQIGADYSKMTNLYGAPVKEDPKKGLLYFSTPKFNRIAHFFDGKCDTISTFSDQTEIGFPVSLTDDQIMGFLKDESKGKEWLPVSRASINKVWNSPDMKSFAIYDTMRHKLVIMSRDAYKRSKPSPTPHG